MTQLELFSVEITVVSEREILDAWTWLMRSLSPRPVRDGGLCIYDLKLWGDGETRRPLEPSGEIASMLGCLYLVSELGDLGLILDIVNAGAAQDLIVPSPVLDEDVKSVLNSKPRFLTGLSEHLAFWVRLATAKKSAEGDCSRFACYLPHVQPEDKGPDGLFFSVGTVSRVEVQSVKNSIGKPQSMISTKRFRLKGEVSASKKRKLLEEFYKFAHEHSGFVRLNRYLADLCNMLGVPADQRIRIALLSSTACSFNAVVVADQRHEKVELFQGYQYIVQDVSRRTATYIGSTYWSEVAESTRQSVMRKLKRLGLL